MTQKDEPQWYAVSGSWREGADVVENDVRHEVHAVLQAGGGIVTGGALGVDYIATDEALKQDPFAQKLKIILPTPLDTYIRHYFNKAAEGVISQKQAQDLSSQLLQVKKANANAIVEMGFDVCNQKTYYARNGAVVDAADALLAFQVNDSKGTQDTIDKAAAKGMTIKHKKYTV